MALQRMYKNQIKTCWNHFYIVSPLSVVLGIITVLTNNTYTLILSAGTIGWSIACLLMIWLLKHESKGML